MFRFKTNLLITKICIYVHSVHIRFKKECSRYNKTSIHDPSILESDASDLFVRTAYNGRVAKHARLYFAVRRKDTGEVQRTSDVSHETEATRHVGSRQGMRVGSFSS